MENINHSPDDRYIILNKASLRPDKIVYYKQFVKKEVFKKTEKVKISKETKEDLLKMGIGNTSVTDSNKHNFNISKKASERIREKVTWLYTLAKKKQITTHTGKIISDFKMNFITLTIPSEQRHTSDQITKECLNQFITELSNKYNMKNYVWRLEFQKNGNIHYHIATDIFIDFIACRQIWNRIIDKLDYVSEYSKKMSKLNFKEYYKLFHKDKTEDYAMLLGRYNAGVATNWYQPNSVDCRNVSSSKKISYYISKYITKNSNDKPNPIIEIRDGTQSNIRLWFCSRSLSKLSKIEILLDVVCDLTDEIIDGINSNSIYIYDYCKVLYYNISEQSNKIKRNLWQLFNNYANDNKYYNTV